MVRFTAAIPADSLRAASSVAPLTSDINNQPKAGSIIATVSEHIESAWRLA